MTARVRLALALQTLVGLALCLALAAGLTAAVRTEPLAVYPWPPLSALRAAALLVLLSACWLLVNAPTEGRVLLALSAERGLTTADLVVLPPLGLALLLVVRAL